MANLVLRLTKGTPLTNTELDNNFSNLNTAKLELGQAQSSATANSVLFFNGSKIVSGGSALTFDGTNLGVSGIVTAGSSVLSTAGGNTARMIAAAGGAYFGSTTAADVIFQYNQNEGMRLTSTGLGIGTSSPAYKLDTLSAGYPAARVRSTFTSASKVYTTLVVGDAATFKGGGIGYVEDTVTAANSYLHLTPWGVAEGNALTINQSANVGIGTSSPSYKLDVNTSGGAQATARLYGNDQANVRLRLENAGSGGRTWEIVGGLPGANNSNFSIRDVTGSTTPLTIDSSGNLGIGTSSPVSALGFGEAASVTGITFQSTNTTFNSGKVAAVKASVAGSGNGSLIFETYQGGSGGGERMRLDSSGNLLVGRSSYSGYGKLNVEGGADFTSGNVLLCRDSGNVGIGTSSPGAKLAVENGNILVRNNAIATGITLQSNQNTGYAAALACNWDENILLLSAAGKKVLEVGGYTDASVLRLFTSNTERARIDSSGNLAIGTTNADSWKLNVTGNAINTGGDVSNLLSLRAGTNSFLSFRAANEGGTAFQRIISTDGLQLHTNNTERVRIDSSGRLQLATTVNYGGTVSILPIGGNPTNASSSLNQIHIGEASANTAYSLKVGYLFINGGYAGSLQAIAGSAGAPLLLNADGGNVGIGTSSPATKLSVLGASGRFSEMTGNTIRNRLAASEGGWLSEIGFANNAGTFLTGMVGGGTGQSADYLGFNRPGNVEAMRINSGGDLLVGTTNGSFGAGVGHKLAAGGTSGQVVNFANGNTYHLFNENGTNNGYRFYVGVNGGVNNYSGNNVNLSDARTKTNVELAGGYLGKICAIPVKLFNYKDEPSGEQKTLGVIAQDVEAVAPELVNPNGWLGEAPEGEEPLKSIYTTDIMFALMRAVQELKAELDAVKAQLPTA